jgi:hypothetical protein
MTVSRAEGHLQSCSLTPSVARPSTHVAKTKVHKAKLSQQHDGGQDHPEAKA